MGRLKHLIVVVPGIGGSVLETLDGQPVWGHSGRELVKAPLDPGRLSVNERLRATDLLPTTRLLLAMKVPGYDTLVRQILNEFGLTPADVDVARPDTEPRPDASVVLFPYDFRQSVRASGQRLADEMTRRLGPIGPDGTTASGRRVIVVAHSMGGLVARWWLGPLGGGPACQSLITVGTPHRGAPKALDWLLNGVRIGPGSVAGMTSSWLKDAAAVLDEWPATYDLLPRYPAVLGPGGLHLRPHELGLASDSFRSRARAAYGDHMDLQTAWAAPIDGPTDRRPPVMCLYGRGHATPARAVIDRGTVRVSRADAEWLSNVGFLGDGTVPAISATPLEHDDDPHAELLRRAVPEPHLPMASSGAILDLLKESAWESTRMVRGDRMDRPWLGFDVDDVVAAGQESTVAVRLWDADPTGAVATLRVTPDPSLPGAAALPAIPMDRDGDRWRATVPGLAPGTYWVAVEVNNVPDVDRVTGADVVGVIEP